MRVVLSQRDYELLCREFGVKPDAQPVRLFDGIDRSGEPSFGVLGANHAPPAASLHADCITGEAARAMQTRIENDRRALLSLATRVVITTKHGPGGSGADGACDPDCLKCEAQRVLDGWPRCPRHVGAGEGVTRLCAMRLHHGGPCR